MDPAQSQTLSASHILNRTGTCIPPQIRTISTRMRRIWGAGKEGEISVLSRGSRALGRAFTALRLRALYARGDYLAAYARHTDIRVAKDPKQAVGGAWDKIGRVQFQFLLDRGLKPFHSLLDIGCGTLRGGRYFIRYLDAGRYTGTDISPGALEAGHHLIEEEGLAAKRPRLVLARDLSFRELHGETFDFVLAQSVFTHLPGGYIEECFRHVAAVMNDNTTFYFTFTENQESRQLGFKDFAHPFIYFDKLAVRYGYHIKDMSSQYRHPRGQRMAALTRAAHESAKR